MSDSGFEFEDDVVDQQPKDPVRAHLRKLEAENKALREKAAAAETAQRELAFVKAGVDVNAPIAKYFVKGYDGDLSPDAIREAAAEANLIKQPAQTENVQLAAEKQAWGRVQEAAKVGEKSEPVLDWNERIANARNQDEVMKILAQAAAEQAKSR